MRIVKVFILCLSFLLTACGAKDEKKAVSFEAQMGEGLPCWQYVQTPEDFSNLKFFKTLFEKNAGISQSQEHKIPKVLHVIWIGPKDFPRESVAYIHSWIEKHPSWKVKFWTDRKRPLPHASMEECFVQDVKFRKLGSCYNASGNFGEKSDVLRYEILFQEGGVYIDHDVKCLQSFDQFNDKYDLYCGLELPSNTPLRSSVHVTNNLIAARPGHPILEKCIDWLSEHWQEIESLYPGSTKEAIIERVSHRTFSAFADAVRENAGKSTSDMVFPAFFFNAPDDSKAIYARHTYAGTWFNSEPPFEKMARQRLMKLSKKVNKILLVCCTLTGLNLIGFGFLLYSLRRHKLKG